MLFADLDNCLRRLEAIHERHVTVHEDYLDRGLARLCQLDSLFDKFEGEGAFRANTGSEFKFHSNHSLQRSQVEHVVVDDKNLTLSV